MSRTCRTCDLAQWELTPKGNPRRSEPGRCAWVMPDIGPVPIAKMHAAEMIKRLAAQSNGIWFDDVDQCPCHIEKGTR
jgi:hypothetical protein